MAFHRAILVVFFLSFLAFQSSKADPIDDACSDSPDPNLCKTSFQSDLRSAGADLKTLVQVGIDLTKSQASSASSLVKNLAEKVTDSNIKRMYDTCQDLFGYATDNLNDCALALKGCNYLEVNRLATSVYDFAGTCNDEFSGQVTEPDELKTASKQVRALSSAILYISNKFIGH